MRSMQIEAIDAKMKTTRNYNIKSKDKVINYK